MGSRGVRPSGTVTFLFTDVEGSTKRWETDSDTMRSELAGAPASDTLPILTTSPR